MASGAIIIYLNWCGSRQAVSVRPIGLSCVEAVKDWVASLRPSSDPFEIAGLKSLASGQITWASALPDNLGPGIPQNALEAGADYEVILGSSSTVCQPTQATPVYVDTSMISQPPIYVHVGETSGDHRQPPIHIDPMISHSPARVYPVNHPFLYDHASSKVYAPEAMHSPVVQKHITNVYYLDEYGNRIPGPEAVTDNYDAEPHDSSARHPSTGKMHRQPSKTRSSTPPGMRSDTKDHGTGHPSPHRLIRSGSTGELWDRLAQPKTPRKPESPRTHKSRLPEGERLQVIERLLMPRPTYEPNEDVGFDPNLRTVYRKMSPEDLDLFVYRMYAPHKHAAPKRDIYDEHKEIERMANSFRDDGPADKPAMDFRRPVYEEEEEDLPRPPVKMTEEERKATAERLYEVAKKQRERRRLMDEDRDRQEMAMSAVPKLKPSDMKAMKERLYKLPKPHPPPPLDTKQPKPLNRGQLKRRLEAWTKPRVRKTEPELPLDCIRTEKQKAALKMTRNKYQQFEERLMLPIGREKIWREAHPVIPGAKKKEMEKKKEGPPDWRNIW